MSVIQNGYCTLAQFKSYIEPPGQTLSIDAADDEIIKTLIEVASRRVDNLCGRVFYPYIETRSYDIPDDDTIWFDADLLAVAALTNGDSTSIAPTEYILKPANAYPKYCLKLKNVSSSIWLTDSDASGEQVIDVLAYWGYHEQYSRFAWVLAGTLAAAIADTTTLTATMTAGHKLDASGVQIIKIDAEIMNTVSVVANVVTVTARGDNGSAAVTHLIGSSIYYWQPMEDITALTIEIARVMYRSRYGENVDVTSTYTPAGIIVTPRSLPVWAQEVIKKYQRLV